MEVLPGPLGYRITLRGARFIVDVYSRQFNRIPKVRGALAPLWTLHGCPSYSSHLKANPIPSNRGYHISKSLCLRSQLPSKDQGHGWGFAITPGGWYYSNHPSQRFLEHLRRFLCHTISIWRTCCQEVLNCPAKKAWVCPCCDPPQTSPGLTSFSHPSPVCFLDHWLQEYHVQQGLHTPKPGHFWRRCKLSFSWAASQTKCCALSNSVWLHFA